MNSLMSSFAKETICWGVRLFASFYVLSVMFDIVAVIYHCVYNRGSWIVTTLFNLSRVLPDLSSLVA